MRWTLAKLSRRERRLAAAAVLAIAGVLAYGTASRLLGRLRELDDTIDRLEAELYQYTVQAARLEEVDRAYAAVAEQHSSEWTQAEIHDRLRTELLRLSLLTLPPPGALPAAFSGEHLVEIPLWPAGALDDRGEGYREYHIRIVTKPTSIANIAVFLQRLHESGQILRVDRMELVRPNPDAADVAVTMTVTRTIIGDAPVSSRTRESEEPENLARNAGFEEWDDVLNTFPEWGVENLHVTQAGNGVGEGSWGLQAAAGEGVGVVYQIQRLRSGATYDLEAEIAAVGAVRLDVLVDETSNAMEGSIPLEGDGLLRRYRVRFTAPAGAADTVFVRAPVIALDEADAQVFMDSVRLVRVKE